MQSVWHLWLKDRAKVDNNDEVCKSVMADMGTLASLFLHFQQQENEQDSSIEDMGGNVQEGKLVGPVRSDQVDDNMRGGEY